ncbi:CRISPR-associated endonuclease Cas2 [Maridesulfovibrio sp.]|uniref:CRISPR-associated endonuclease Cas2 n=1 Tax=Maridesulfovibrio sp. TaxID=2795000 RepID=UPI0029F49361|nr:CRISPR-associated endonuclease Cas2 [Maridesulfovibrio sp.]
MYKAPYFISFDITKNKTRRKVWKILKEWNIASQKSASICSLSLRQAQELFGQLQNTIDEDDSLLMARLTSLEKTFARKLIHNEQ